MPRFPQEIAGSNKAILRDNGGLHGPLIRPAISNGGIGGPLLDSHDSKVVPLNFDDTPIQVHPFEDNLKEEPNTWVLEAQNAYSWNTPKNKTFTFSLFVRMFYVFYILFFPDLFGFCDSFLPKA